VENYVPKRKPGNRPQAPWMTQEVRIALKRRDQMWKKYRNSGDLAFYGTYKELRNKAVSVVRSAKKAFEQKLAKEVNTNPKSFWSYVKSKVKAKEGIGNLKNEDGTLTTSDTEKANTLNDFFSSVFTDEFDTNTSSTKQVPEPVHLDEIYFTEDIIVKALGKLKTESAPGPDLLPPRVLKEARAELALPLSILFTRSLTEGKLPLEWKDAMVTPIFKKGNKQEAGNYRPVSLTCVLCKVMENIIRSQILDYTKLHNLFNSAQYGFRCGQSCDLQLLAALDKWSADLDKGIPTDVLYLDFQKAFDTVPHIKLCTKLETYGICGNLLAWIKDFLSERRQKVRVGEAQSSWTKVKSGVPQGSVLGPVLFLFYVNDMPDNCMTNVLMFADDTKASNAIQSKEESEKLQEDLNSLHGWTEKWQLQFNKKKCKVLHIGPKNQQYTYSITDPTKAPSILEASSYEKDLGVCMDNQLVFDEHITQITAKANRIAGLIFRTFREPEKTPLYPCTNPKCAQFWNTVVRSGVLILFVRKSK
jgi:hypothetical protein